VSIHDSLHRLATAWKISELHKFLHNILESPYIELGQLAKLKGAVSAATASLDTLTAVILWCHTSGTPKQAVVTIQKIVLGGLIVKTHKLSLQQMGALPFSVIVPLKSLCTRNAEEPHMVPPQLLAAAKDSRICCSAKDCR
jgi:hypothetical protein